MTPGSQHVFRSGDPHCPASADVIRFVLDKLQQSDDWDWAWIRPVQSAWKNANSSQVVQISVSGDCVLLDILGFPFGKDYQQQFRDRAILIPESWEVEKFQPHGLLRKGVLSLRVPEHGKDQMSSFILSVLHLLFGAEERCPIEAELLHA